jgi:hypothetical protein
MNSGPAKTLGKRLQNQRPLGGFGYGHGDLSKQPGKLTALRIGHLVGTGHGNRGLTALRHWLVAAVVLICLVTLTLAVMGCEPLYTFEVQNYTDRTLGIYVDEFQISSVESGETIKCKIQGSAGWYLIVARDPKGTVYYSANVSYEQLRGGKYLIIVKPP